MLALQPQPRKQTPTLVTDDSTHDINHDSTYIKDEAAGYLNPAASSMK
jgi:hypothetical protein